MMQQIFVVDEATCVGCGECAADCPYGLIVMDGDRPHLPAEQAAMCVNCHHCLAICPTAAVTIHGCKPEDSLPLPGNKPTAEQMAMLIKSRRTTRRYQPESLTREEIDYLMETLAYAPTGVNNRGVLFTLIDDPKVMEVFRQATYKALQEKMDGGGLPAGMEYLEEAVKRAKESGIDTIFRGAPNFIIASSPQGGPSPEVDCHIALSYFELLAAGMGLGTVWSGLAKWSLTMLAPQLLQQLGIPESHSIGYMMAFGRPAVTYHRTVQRQNRAINRVTSFNS
jgi:nitroreductase/NAD-dependent dihydropyrimidine dehydrogenase PreA subunit